MCREVDEVENELKRVSFEDEEAFIEYGLDMMNPLWMLGMWKEGRMHGYPECCIEAFVYDPWRIQSLVSWSAWEREDMETFIDEWGRVPCNDCMSKWMRDEDIPVTVG